MDGIDFDVIGLKTFKVKLIRLYSLLQQLTGDKLNRDDVNINLYGPRFRLHKTMLTLKVLYYINSQSSIPYHQNSTRHHSHHNP